MGLDYLLIHIQYTFPPAILMSILYRPLARAADVYKALFLITVAVIATIPWDSYLIRTKIWTYPDHAVLGPTLFAIPIEELIFFVIQTYNTTMMYLLATKPLVLPIYLLGRQPQVPAKTNSSWLWRVLSSRKSLGAGFLIGMTALGAWLIYTSPEAKYLGLILAWCGPFILFQWTLASQFIMNLPWATTWLPIILSTAYLWVVDTIALRQGTWVIEEGTKIDVQVWKGLEIEEALFFLCTNIMIVFGLATVDKTLSLLELQPKEDEAPSQSLPAAKTIAHCMFHDGAEREAPQIHGLVDALTRLQRKSQSFFMASIAFRGRLRMDLIYLYSFCRTADDLIDNAPDTETARQRVDILTQYINHVYKNKKRSSDRIPDEQAKHQIQRSLPPWSYSGVLLFPAQRLSSKPILDLLEGFRMDLEFDSTRDRFPIDTEAKLDLYAAYVAGTIAVLILELIFHHEGGIISGTTTDQQPPKPAEEYVRYRDVIAAGEKMGRALQFINIARDIVQDANVGRVYIPTTWLKESGLTPADVLKNPTDPALEPLRDRLLDKADRYFKDTYGAIEEVPRNMRGPLRATVKSYLEISNRLKEDGGRIQRERVRVPLWRRLQVVYSVL